MIRINRIEPIGGINGKVPIRAIRNEYYDRLHQKGRCQIKNTLKNALQRGYLYKTALTVDEKNLLQYILNHYKSILIGDVNILNKIKNDISINNWEKLVYNYSTTKFGKKLLTVFGYTNRFRSEQERGIWLAKQLNIKSCPYCNAQYTLHVQSTSTAGIAKFQFDHFFSKDRYPYFSVSLYNLIPSCASCNHKKSSVDFSILHNYHPYYNSLAAFAKFKLKYPADLDKLSFDAIRKMDYDKELEIKFVPLNKGVVKFVNTHNTTFDIEPIYERHKDHAHELLLNSVMYDRYYQKTIINIKGLFPDKPTMMKYLLSNYMNEHEIIKRPLAKFYQDLAQQLRLID